jgi:hypothetical protein
MQSANPFDAPSSASPTADLKSARPKGEFAYIITCLVLTLLWAFVAGSNQLLFFLGLQPWEDERFLQLVVIPGWIILFLLGIPSLLNVYRGRLNSAATIVQIIVLTLLCYTIPFAIWGAVQLYFSRAHDSKARMSQS